MEAHETWRRQRDSDRDGETEREREDTLISLSPSLWVKVLISDKRMSIYIRSGQLNQKSYSVLLPVFAQEAIQGENPTKIFSLCSSSLLRLKYSEAEIGWP